MPNFMRENEAIKNSKLNSIALPTPHILKQKEMEWYNHWVQGTLSAPLQAPLTIR